MNDNIVYEYKFGTIGKKEVVFDGEHLTINGNAIGVQNIKCIYIKYPTNFQNGTVYFSMDGNDIGAAAAINKNAFMYIKSQQNSLDELLNCLGLEVINSEKESVPKVVKSEVTKNEKKGIVYNVLDENKQKKERIKKMDSEGITYCPKCKGTSIQYVERRKTLSLGRAVTGGVLLGPIGAGVGAVTSKKYKGFVKCMNCGHKWKM